jgi:hypothetical protein
MRSTSILTGVVLTAVSFSTAFAGERLFGAYGRSSPNYDGKDGGALVMSVETTDSTRFGFAVENDDRHYVAVRYISPGYERRAHDFGEQVTYVDAWGAPDPTGDSAQMITYWSRVEIIKLPPGRYHLTEFRCDFELRVTTRFYALDIPFTIEPGRITYLGEARTLPGTWAPKIGPLPLGAVYNAPVAIKFIDQAARDLVARFT